MLASQKEAVFQHVLSCKELLSAASKGIKPLPSNQWTSISFVSMHNTNNLEGFFFFFWCWYLPQIKGGKKVSGVWRPLGRTVQCFWSKGTLGGIARVWVYLLIRIKVPLWFTLIHFGMQSDKSIFVGDPSVWGARSLRCPAKPGAPPWEPDGSSA